MKICLRDRVDTYPDKIRHILENADKYHGAYYKAETFKGPSLYFHRRALETRRFPINDVYLEYVYATLASWGMHRMGKGGSKMQSFDSFRKSVASLKNEISEAQNYHFQDMDVSKWSVIKKIFRGLNVMSSETSIVGNSKVMHHIIPDVVPPIDREYTLRFLHGNTNIKNDIEEEWQLMRSIISEFFIPVASDRGFYAKAKEWTASQNQYPWDTSILKVVDNLIIGARK